MSDPSLVNVGDLRTDADDLLSFCLEQLPGFTREHFEKYFRGNPSGAPLFVVGRDADGNLTGTASLHPVPFAVAGEVTDGAVAGDFVVRDDLRGFGPALGLQRALLDAAAERGWSLAIGFPNAAARAVLRRVGYRDLAACLRFTRPIGRREHVTSLLPRRSSSRVESAPSFDDRFTALWQAFSGTGAGTHRSVALQNWRFELEQPEPGRFSISAAADGTGVRAYAVSHVVWGKRRIVDLAWADTESLEAVLRHDIDRAKGERLAGVDVLYLGPPDRLQPTLERLGFVAATDAHAIVRGFGAAAVPDPARWELFDGSFDL